ncbi:MAG: hypothetical protein J0H62_02575 [Rhizobiales bacterium]|nr:hypothetical protein [Hyphomicrobiales bacterium]
MSGWCPAVSFAAMLMGGFVYAAVAQDETVAREPQARVFFAERMDGKYAAVRDEIEARGILEAVAGVLNAFRLPRQLTVEVKGCEGRETAWYAFGRANFCYEYVDLIRRHLPAVATPGGVHRDDVIVGVILDTILHEAAHGLIDILGIPVIGREEDAADFISIYFLLQFPREDARRLINGVAFSVGSEAREDLREALRPEAFADTHGLNAQRHYNVLCLAYGADPALFGDVALAVLPAWRARNCGDEWSLLRRGLMQALLPHLDETKLNAAVSQARFKWRPLVTAVDTFDKPPLETLKSIPR